ncbi:pyridoxamine 5'-phosphate oxidase [Candidatus Blochmanniella camponoti]|uniref:Pyridoxine/pyridoxamine 5'-phosphate oxidase n=1 Tax=Candidatus Blochmanniella camponoti TaxID=108080 RepID=A0ABY4SSC4_9ENTR|nr:pyridoxamine 5'-phosphate oxidase [Candidatus Blochmannia herculeanus]URJ24776.1 pyridoxamine 5'-phosphate oxidase [Candidatus Blochmannia herculeanus]URJ27165.1 pyridoxamine 5'-phosphate oxidase [Candidatus Blochmannia herculeanus]
MLIDKTNISNIRREYISGQLRHTDLTNQPIQLFSVWLHQAYFSKIPDPTAMCLATVDHTGQPYQRVVLLKNFTNKEMIFYTNLNSRKAMHLANNPKVSLCFLWNVIDRQVIITGSVNKLPEKEVLKHFYTRPKNNQISAWVSNQSKVISSKDLLENKFLEFKKNHLHKKVPFPEFWGGYKININSMEFWQGGTHRLHDRFIYQRYKHTWRIYRLSP